MRADDEATSHSTPQVPAPGPHALGPLTLGQRLFGPSDPAPGQTLSEWLFGLSGLRWLLWMLVAWGFLGAVLDNPHSVSSAHDWTYFTHHLQSAHLTYTQYGEIPFWDPYFCGGILGLGNTQSNAVSPMMLLSLLFGALEGARIAYWLMFVLGMEGAYQYGKRFGLVGLGGVVAGVVFGCSGRVTQTFADGQPALLGYLLIPWVLIGFERGLVRWRWAVIGAVAMATIFCEGGAIPTPIAAVFLGLSMLWATAKCAIGGVAWRWYRPLLTLTVMALLTIGLSAVRFFPVAESLVLYPRVWNVPEAYPVSHIISMMIVRVDGNPYFGAGSSYIGAFTFLLAILGVFTRDRVALRFALFGLIALELSMGSDNVLGLYDLSKKLPFFKNLRNPFRYTVVLGLFIALGAGRTLQLLEVWLVERAKGFGHWRAFEVVRGKLRGGAQAAWTRGATPVAVGVALLVSAWLGYRIADQVTEYNSKRIQDIFTITAPHRAPEGQPFKQSVGDRWVAHVWSAANMGTLSCFEEQPYPQSPLLRGDLPQEEYLANPEAGTAKEVSWSPHRIEVEVDLKVPTTLMVNQNVHRGWKTNIGQVFDRDGLLTVALPEGKHTVILEFSDPLMNAGLWVSISTLLGLLITGAVWAARTLRTRRAPPSLEAQT
jgi:hypothetical protein